MVQQQRLTQLLGGDQEPRRPAAHPHQQRIDELKAQKQRLQEQLASYRHVAQRYETDPAVRHHARATPADHPRASDALPGSPGRAGDRRPLHIGCFSYSSEEVGQLEREVKVLLDRMQESMPQFRDFQSLVHQRESKQAEVDDYRQKLNTFGLLKQTQNRPVGIRLPAEEPTLPVGPNRKLNLALVIPGGLGLGLGLVCLLESLDHGSRPRST